VPCFIGSGPLSALCQSSNHACLRSRGEHLDRFALGFLIFFALQLGLWRYLCTAGRRRRFWLGFEAAGIAATLALSMTSLCYGDLNDWYTGAATDLSYLCLPVRVDVALTHEHWDWFLAIIYFLPELLTATLGGLLTACLFRRIGEAQSVHAVQAPTRK
jgi:hypothetical protein